MHSEDEFEDEASSNEGPGPSKPRGQKCEGADNASGVHSSVPPAPRTCCNHGAYPFGLDPVQIPTNAQKRDLRCAYRYDNGEICNHVFTFDPEPSAHQRSAAEEHVRSHMPYKKNEDLPKGTPIDNNAKYSCWQCNARGIDKTLVRLALRRHIFDKHIKTTDWKCERCGKTLVRADVSRIRNHKCPEPEKKNNGDTKGSSQKRKRN